MKIDKDNDKHIIADDGKTFERIADGTNYGKEIYLGYSYSLVGRSWTFPTLTRPRTSGRLTSQRKMNKKRTEVNEL